ncbi:MAG: hypothetical protein OEZ48_04170 [Candidatus Bathyarchaeota archaeon]|nr:hypothetical protein [Candidatus Bathyarchaeota archaeon]
MDAVRYASRSVNWTFNRLAIRASEWTWYKRMMRIVTGVTVQQCLISELQRRGIAVLKDWSNYRTEDTFDIGLPAGRILDVKSFAHYREYDKPKIRSKFTLRYLIENRNYEGADYRRFFPCLVPSEQFDVKTRRHKDYYIFAIVSSINFIREKFAGRKGGYYISVVPMQLGDFLNYKKLVLAREEEGKGISITFSLKSEAKLDKYLRGGEKRSIGVYIGYEKAGEFREEAFDLKEGDSIDLSNLSGFSYVRVDKEDFKDFVGCLTMEIENLLDKEVLSGFKNRNILPQTNYAFRKEHFANLYLPESRIFFLGWIDRKSFVRRRAKLPCYGPPNDKVNKYLNREGVPPIPGVLYPRTACFFYPNIWGAGLINKNYYVLPRDLNIMDEFS